MRNKILQRSCLLFTLFLLFPMICLADCISFCFVTKDELLYGNNLDWHVGDGIIVTNKRNVLKTSFIKADISLRWVSKYGSITINQVGREFPLRGMNERGLVLGIMALDETEYPSPDSRSLMPPEQWVQYILDNCATIEDVIEANSKIQIVPDAYPIHFLVADSSGNCVTMEWLDGKLITHTGKNLPIKVLTNSTYEKSIDYYNNGRYPSPDLSLNAFYRAVKLIKDYDPNEHDSELKYAFGILEDVKSLRWKWSLVYDIKNLIFYFRTNLNENIGYVDFGSFDFSCETPVKIFNINNVFNGNTQAQFVDYSSDMNYELISNLNKKFGNNIPAEHIALIANYPETTVCNPDKSFQGKQK